MYLKMSSAKCHLIRVGLDELKQLTSIPQPSKRNKLKSILPTRIVRGQDYIAERSLSMQYFFPHNFISPYLHFYVTTRQSSTYKQSTMDSEVRKLDYIRTLVTSCDNKTIFLKFSQQTTHISPVRVRNGVPIVFFLSLNCVLLLSVQCCA